MKNKFIYTLLASMIFASCGKEFLETQPATMKVETNFYKTQEDAFEGLVATYDVLQRIGYGNALLTTEMASDNCFGGSGKSDNQNNQKWDGFGQSYDLNLGLWTNDYLGVYRANMIISKIDEINFKNPELKPIYLAEARFLRAYFHLELAQTFEKVSLVDHVLATGETPLQSTPEQLYKFIAEDLKFAIENLPSKSYAQISSNDYGRVTKSAAQGLMARVFLFYTDYYEKADLAGVVNKTQVTAYLEDLIANGGYGLVAKYKSLWKASSMAEYAGEDNKEVVWSIKFTSTGKGDWNLHDGNRWQVMIGLRNQKLGNYSNGWGFATVNPKFYESFQDGDTRRDASIISFKGENLEFDASDQRQYTGYVWKKYLPVAVNGKAEAEALGGNFQIDNIEDFMVIRYADILLMAAELNLGTNLAKAQGYFNQVHTRAMGDANSVITLTTDAAGKKAIMAERRFEFGLEGLRYWDLIRQDLSTAAAAIDNVDTKVDDDDFNIKFRAETRGFFAIPESEITLSNGVLKQNPGWN